MSSTAYLGLGSNLGNRKRNLADAVMYLSGLQGLLVHRVSLIYETEPIGLVEQAWFYNAVAELETEIEPEELLQAMLEIENKMGRVRTVLWGPRVIDLDLLLYDQIFINRPHLQIPHPRLKERAFVVVPLAEISPGLILPDGTQVSQLAAELEKKQKVIATGLSVS